MTERERCGTQRLNLERQRTKKERDRGVKQRQTVAVTASAHNNPTGHHRPVLQMSAQSGPPWEASKTPWDLQESRSQLTWENWTATCTHTSTQLPPLILYVPGVNMSGWVELPCLNFFPHLHGSQTVFRLHHSQCVHEFFSKSNSLGIGRLCFSLDVDRPQHGW